VSNKLDQSVFPYVKDTPVASGTPTATSLRSSASTGGGGAATPPTSLRSAKPSWHRAARPGAAGGAAAETRQRLLVFVAGGMTYSEIREAYQLSSSLNKDIIIGALIISFFFRST
jgi:syntaxin-binding protein 1